MTFSLLIERALTKIEAFARGLNQIGARVVTAESIPVEQDDICTTCRHTITVHEEDGRCGVSKCACLRFHSEGDVTAEKKCICANSEIALLDTPDPQCPATVHRPEAYRSAEVIPQTDKTGYTLGCDLGQLAERLLNAINDIPYEGVCECRSRYTEHVAAYSDGLHCCPGGGFYRTSRAFTEQRHRELQLAAICKVLSAVE